MTLSLVDWIIIAVYLVGCMIAGIWMKRYVRGVDDFAVAGREMDVNLGVASLAATEVGIVTIMYTAQMGFTHGPAGATPGVVTAIAMFVVGLTGFVIVPMRNAGVLTIPQLFEKRFGTRVRWLAGLVVILGGVLNMGIFLRVGGQFLMHMTGIPLEHLEWIMTALLVVVLVYTVLGGMLSVLVTDYLQFIVMGLGIVITSVLVLWNVDWSNVVKKLPEAHQTTCVLRETEEAANEAEEAARAAGLKIKESSGAAEATVPSNPAVEETRTAANLARRDATKAMTSGWQGPKADEARAEAQLTAEVAAARAEKLVPLRGEAEQKAAQAAARAKSEAEEARKAAAEFRRVIGKPATRAAPPLDPAEEVRLARLEARLSNEIVEAARAGVEASGGSTNRDRAVLQAVQKEAQAAEAKASRAESRAIEVTAAADRAFAAAQEARAAANELKALSGDLTMGNPFNPVGREGLGWGWVVWQIMTAVAVVTTWQTTIARVLAARDARSAKRIYRRTAFYFVGRFGLPGLWGAAAFLYFYSHGGLPTGVDSLTAMPTYLQMILPSGLIGIMIAAMLAAEMSTDSGYLLTWATVIYNDLINPCLRRPLAEKSRLVVVRVLVLLIGLFLVFYGLWYQLPGAAWDYLAVTGNIYLASLFTLLVGALYWRGANRAGAMAAIILGAAGPLSFLVINAIAPEGSPWRIAPEAAGIAAFLCSFVGMIVGSLVGRLFGLNDEHPRTPQAAKETTP